MLYASYCDPAQLSEVIEGDLSSISLWIKSNGLKMNMDKTQLMVLNRKSKSSKIEQIQVTVNGTRGRNKDLNMSGQMAEHSQLCAVINTVVCAAIEL